MKVTVCLTKPGKDLPIFLGRKLTIKDFAIYEEYKNRVVIPIVDQNSAPGCSSKDVVNPLPF